MASLIWPKHTIWNYLETHWFYSQFAIIFCVFSIFHFPDRNLQYLLVFRAPNSTEWVSLGFSSQIATISNPSMWFWWICQSSYFCTFFLFLRFLFYSYSSFQEFFLCLFGFFLCLCDGSIYLLTSSLFSPNSTFTLTLVFMNKKKKNKNSEVFQYSWLCTLFSINILFSFFFIINYRFNYLFIYFCFTLFLPLR